MPAPLRIQTVLLRPGARLPRRQSASASGYDLHACLSGAEGVLEGGTLLVGATPVAVPTGIAIAAPPGTDVQIRPRSGLSLQGVIAALGTVDADYRGELLVTMYCLPARGTHVVRDGDRIAQLVIARLTDVEWTAVPGLEATERGDAGHGSTGAQ